MRKLAILVFAVASSCCIAVAQTPERPLTSFPYTPGLDVNAMPENLRVKALTDPHSPGKYRVNALVVNMRAFSCKPGQPMVGANRCRVW
jgi:hypothetical protein